MTHGTPVLPESGLGELDPAGEPQRIAMRDGVRLHADLYRPDAAAPTPAVLIRLPYGTSRGLDTGESRPSRA